MLFFVLGLMSVTEPVIDLNKALSRFHNLQANVQQITETQSGQTLKSSGLLWLERPNQFRYQIKSPNEQLYVSDGHQLWNYDKPLLQVIVQPLNRQIQQTPLLLLSGKVSDISKLFKVTSIADGEFELIPKSKDNLISKIVMTFKLGHPEDMQLTNPFGQITTINFTDVRMNQPISKSLFQFVPPKGVDVLRQG